MASPPTSPISGNQSTAAGQSSQPIGTPAFRAFITRLSSSISRGFANRRPWLELVDRSSLVRPDSLSDAASRLRKNLSYFRVNYITPLVLFGRAFSDRETLGVLIVSTVVVVFLTSVGSVLISAVLVGLAIVCVHGAFRVPEDLFLDDQEPANTGFLSFIGGAASSAAAAAAPAVAARV
ncbi:prenylated RAB acceptor 1.B5 [Actinidia rufa]|uniref:PRA1 family protein n=1 Tax=Actinidia rufa TaxID=165716 RepID=A0A7J0E6N5_9ERIC|nr:prenylated RAB acceptor 1.B5 [Actinidia rufa]